MHNSPLNSRYHYRYGFISATTKKNVIIQLESQEKLKKCTGCSLCSTEIPTVTVTIKKQKEHQEFSNGAQVALGIVKLNEVEAALIAFILPLFIALLTYFLLTTFGRFDGDSAVAVGSTLGAGALTLYLVTVIDSLLQLLFTPELIPIAQLSDPERQSVSCLN